VYFRIDRLQEQDGPRAKEQLGRSSHLLIGTESQLWSNRETGHYYCRRDVTFDQVL
jgi:hypothetical protein